MKNDNTIFLIIGIIILFLVFTNISILPKEDFVTIKVHYYDQNGNEIFPLISTGTFSIVHSTSEISPDIGTIELSLLDDGAGFVAKEDIEHNFENGLPDNPEDEVEEVPSTPISFWKNLIAQIGAFGIVTTTKTIRIDASNTDTYCNRRTGSSGYNFDPNRLNDIGSDEMSGGYEVCNGLMQFPVTGLPADLTSASQIISVSLQYFTGAIWSDEGNGASTDFGLVSNLENYDWTPNSESEDKIMFDMLEAMSNTGIEIYTYRFQETEEFRWFSNQIGTTNVKNEIIANRDGIPDNVLAIGIEGESDPNDDERVDFDDENDINKPRIVIKYTVTTCVPDTCSSLGKQCGTWDDTCGGTITCGTCDVGDICSSGGQCLLEPTYISFEVTATNTGDIPFENLAISSATPIEFWTALPTTIYNLSIGGSQTWISGQIEIKSEWSASTVFEVCVEGIFITFTEQTEIECSSISGVI